MKQLFLWMIAAASLVAGCSKSSNSPTGPTTPSTGEDWTFPANTTKFSATLTSSKNPVAVGDIFYAKIVYYNITQTFGTAIELTYPSDKVRILDLTPGPLIANDSTSMDVIQIDSVAGKVSFGITYKAGSGKVFNGSNVLARLRCQGKATGTGTFAIVPSTLEIDQSDGTAIPNFSTLQIENLSLQVQ